MKRILTISLITCFYFTASAPAFNGHIVTEGPLKLTIGDIQNVTQYDSPREVSVTLGNSNHSPLNVQLRMAGLVDEWYAVGQTEKRLSIPPRREANATFRIAAGQGGNSALYPVHIYATFQHNRKTLTAHAVQIFLSTFKKPAASSQKPAELPVNIVPAKGALPLWTLQTHRVAWSFYDKPLTYMPVGWKGSCPESSATFSIGQVTRETSRHAIQMHPPWKPHGGTVFAEYFLKLPNVTPIKLTFANAIRDHTDAEPPSDGVTFRVWAGSTKLFEQHTDSKKWLPGHVDLSKFAGKKILLRLESHPGPKRNTTCDSSYWAEPTIIAGLSTAKPVPEADREALRHSARTLVKTANGRGFMFALDDGYRVAFLPYMQAINDAVIAIGNSEKCVVFDGFKLEVMGREVSKFALCEHPRFDTAGRSLVASQNLWLGDEKFELTMRIRPEKAALRIAFECPKRITDIALGPADRKAPRVYYGHGYCIVEPKAFRAGFGGHNLSTSHVGFDFENGLSLLTACDNPPDFLEVNPETRTYALHTHMNATMTLVPSSSGAFDCARKYRPLYDKKAAPAVKRKAGRFVFDIWGGRYAEIAETMKRMIAYGLTDSLLTVHVWQRWGYDYRLPDIYPPQPRLGTVQDMQQIANVCAEQDIPWGLHDNYIDFYPDAADYSYDHICFTGQGTPIKAWINEGRNAQSYRWRPDHIMPFVKRNMKLIKPNLKPTHYFIDVFTSLHCFDFYDRHGKFHSMLETRKCWGEAFAWIRDYLGGNAPTTSEAGHDQLIGYLDGSDCQHMTLSPDKGWPHIRISCNDWQRVPWFDAVLHDKFSLHGVGYPSRYKLSQPGNQARILESDDYITAEILEGHALMIDRGGFGRGAVRKYWLAQDFIKSIALDQIEDVELVDTNIHRQIITWKSGAKVYVNRGVNDWNIAGKTLPQYGYFAKNGPIESAIEKINAVIVEQSRGPARFYFNARGFGPDDTLAIRPTAESVEYLGERRFRLLVNWDAQQPAPKDLSIFIHFNSEKSDRPDKIAFQSDGNPPTPTGKWKGRITTGTGRIVEIPKAFGPGEYEITIGLWDPSTGRRYALRGDNDGSRRYRLGKLIAEAASGKITNIRLVKHQTTPRPPLRWNAAKLPIDFGTAVTKGAFRCQLKNNIITVTPLPDLEPFIVTLRTDKLTGAANSKIKSITAIDIDGKKIRSVDYNTKTNTVWFQTRKNEFAYRISLQR